MYAYRLSYDVIEDEISQLSLLLKDIEEYRKRTSTIGKKTSTFLEVYIYHLLAIARKIAASGIT